AESWFELEGRRRPHFKQVLQDLEHTGRTEQLDLIATELRTIVSSAPASIPVESVLKDLFSTMKAPLGGYRRMIWTTAAGDDGHWNADASKARELFVANRFRVANPSAAIRVLVFDVPMSHYGHIERPRQLAGCLLAAVKWLHEGPVD
ncbi:MAG: hypothetical protein ACRD1T_25235, partial [Acidimicrobiia bacterium]